MTREHKSIIQTGITLSIFFSILVSCSGLVRWTYNFWNEDDGFVDIWTYDWDWDPTYTLDSSFGNEEQYDYQYYDEEIATLYGNVASGYMKILVDSSHLFVCSGRRSKQEYVDYVGSLTVTSTYVQQSYDYPGITQYAQWSRIGAEIEADETGSTYVQSSNRVYDGGDYHYIGVETNFFSVV